MKYSVYNIKMVSKRIGIPPVTIRAWENRYGVVNPIRTEAGHRLYSEQDVEDLLWLKNQTEGKGLNISQAAKMLEQVKKQNAQQLPAKEPMTPHSFQTLHEELHHALCTLNGEQANSVLELGFSMFHYEDMFHHVLAPIMHRIGEEWENGKVSIAQEHFATNLISQRFFQFFRVFPINHAMPKAIALCPPGEYHQVGLLLFVLFLRKNGVEVIYLGANTPIDGVSAIIQNNRIQILCVSITDKKHLEGGITLLNNLIAEFPHLNLILGGQGFESIEGSLKKNVLSGGHEKWQEWFQHNFH